MSEAAGVFPPAVDQDPLRASLDCLREGFQIIGYDWRYVYVNPAAARHGRRASSELIGKPISEMYPGIEQTPLFESMRKCMADRTSYVFENQFTFPDGTRRWFEIRIQPVPAGICIYSSDIDDRKLRERAGSPASPSPKSWLRRVLTAITRP
jgi:PAS domain S-box-containing protein